MTGTIKMNGVYGAKIGNITVFTHERAVEVFKIVVEHCYENLTMGSCAVLDDVAEDMHKIGFDWDEIEKIEIETISN